MKKLASGLVGTVMLGSSFGCHTSSSENTKFLPVSFKEQRPIREEYFFITSQNPDLDGDGKITFEEVVSSSEKALNSLKFGEQVYVVSYTNTINKPGIKGVAIRYLKNLEGEEQYLGEQYRSIEAITNRDEEGVVIVNRERFRNFGYLTALVWGMTPQDERLVLNETNFSVWSNYTGPTDLKDMVIRVPNNMPEVIDPWNMDN